jgi:hypothetical protein
MPTFSAIVPLHGTSSPSASSAIPFPASPSSQCRASRFIRDIELVKALLHRAPIGFHVVVYNGFGGHIPAGFELLRSERRRTLNLELWRKAEHDEATHAELAPRAELRQVVDIDADDLV